MSNPPGVWRISGSSLQFYCPGYALYGTVTKTPEGWHWEARTLLSSREYGYSDKPPRGFANTCAQAQKIVETLLYETDTVRKEKNVT